MTPRNPYPHDPLPVAALLRLYQGVAVFPWERCKLLLLAEACGCALPSRASVARIVGWQRVERAEAEAISEAVEQAQEAVEQAQGDTP